MESTSESLLQRLRQPADQEAWQRFVRIYTPLLLGWLQRIGVQDADAADLVQDVFAKLVQKLPEFHYDAAGSFRAYLYQVVRNAWLEKRRKMVPTPADPAADVLARLESPDETDLFADAEHRKFVVARVLQIMQTDFETTTWQACWQFVVNQKPAAQVASELGITTKAVYVAKARVLRRLREEVQGLLD